MQLGMDSLQKPKTKLWYLEDPGHHVWFDTVYFTDLSEDFRRVGHGPTSVSIYVPFWTTAIIVKLHVKIWNIRLSISRHS